MIVSSFRRAAHGAQTGAAVHSGDEFVLNLRGFTLAAGKRTRLARVDPIFKVALLVSRVLVVRQRIELSIG